MSTPSPSPSPPLLPPNPTPLSAKKPQPVPWTHQETVHLIQAYQEKWYSLKRGPLKASQWEEVAVTVAARCGYDYNHPAKSSTQCRHKMEKLRKRYREENRRISLGDACSWQYFELMHCLERGPLPISALPLPSTTPFQVSYKYNATNNNNHILDEDPNNEEEEEEEEEDEEEEEYGYRSKSRSINYILRKPSIVNRFAGRESRIFERVAKKRGREEMTVEEEEEEEGEKVEMGLAEEIKAFAKRMMRLERKKMEMVRETERWRLEMENKRMEMILDSQRKIVHQIARAFGSQLDQDFFS